MTGCRVMVTVHVASGPRPYRIRQVACGAPSIIPESTQIDEFGPYQSTPMCGAHAQRLGRILEVAS